MAGPLSFVSAGLTILGGYTQKDAYDKQSRSLERASADRRILLSANFRGVLGKGIFNAFVGYVDPRSATFMQRMASNEANFRRDMEAERLNTEAKIYANDMAGRGAVLSAYAQATEQIAGSA